MSEPSGHAESGPSQKEYIDLLLELSVALHKHGMYPAGHPALAHLSAGLHDRLSQLFAVKGQIAIGVARRQLMVEGVATDPENPVLRRLAETLHDHQLAAVSIVSGLDATELADALRVLAEPAQRGPIGLVAADARPSWPHVRLHPLTFDNLSIGSDELEAADAGNRFEGADLWMGLAQAALACDTPLDDGRADAHAPDAVARAIDGRAGAPAYDQVVAGYLLQIARALRTATGEEADALRASTSALIASLQPGTLRRLVRTSRTDGGPHAFVRDAVNGLRVDAVLELLKAAADVSGETISHGMLRMLTKLAAHAEGTAGRGREAAQEGLRDQVSRLLADWKLADPNPESYGRLLQQLATSAQDATTEAVSHDDLRPSLRIVEMGLELGELGPLALKAVDDHLAAGGVADLVALLDVPPAGAGAALDVLSAKLRAPAVLTRLLGEEPVNFAALDALLPSMTAPECGPLIDALADSNNRITRRRLLDRLADAPQDLSPNIVSRLSDSRWHVQRNLLVLLERRRPVPSGFTPRPWMANADWRVRLEAVRLALAIPQERSGAIDAALGDSQPRVVSLGVAALAEEPPGTRASQLAVIALKTDFPDDTRIPALSVLGKAPQPVTLQTVTALLDGGRTVFGRRKLPEATPLTLLALGILGHHFTGEAAAQPFLKAARRSSNRDVRAAITPPPAS